jgi:toxin ParE1/3/4
MVHRLSLTAKAELDSIWDYVVEESGSERVADRQINLLTSRFYLLATHPKIGRMREDLGPGRRSYTVERYIIIYQIIGEDVLILHVIHSRRDLQTLMHRRDY